jgi:predicted enzyme related to lactoylglutathione lyase
MVHFNVEDVDKAFKKATEAGGREIWIARLPGRPLRNRERPTGNNVRSMKS